MIRTALSFVVLLGSLLMVSKLLHQSSAHESPDARKVPPAVKVGESGQFLAPAVSEQASEPALADGAEFQLPGDVVFVSAEYEAATAKAVPPAASPDPKDQSAEKQTDADEDAPPAELSDLSKSKPVEEAGQEPNKLPLTEEKPLEKTTVKPVEKSEAKKSDDSKPEKSADPAPPEAPLLPELTPEFEALRPKLKKVLEYYYTRRLNTRENQCWEAMHAMIAFGIDTELELDGPGGRRVNAVGWLCFNGPCRGFQLFQPTPDGKFTLPIFHEVQGHPGQFLAMLAQSRVKTDYPVKVGGKEYTVKDLIEHEKFHCQSGTELTFKLIAFSHYLDHSETWTNFRGEKWDLQRMIKEELASPVIGAACGGTHRMMGFAYAVRKHEKLGLPIEGQWARAKKYLEDFHVHTFKLQNQDGSFSTRFFEGPEASPDVDQRLNTTGHTLEWLAFSLKGDEIQSEKVAKAANYLCDLLWQNRERRWPIGPRGHSLHALVELDERLYGAKPGERLKRLAAAEGQEETITDGNAPATNKPAEPARQPSRSASVVPTLEPLPLREKESRLRR